MSIKEAVARLREELERVAASDGSRDLQPDRVCETDLGEIDDLYDFSYDEAVTFAVELSRRLRSELCAELDEWVRRVDLDQRCALIDQMTRPGVVLRELLSDHHRRAACLGEKLSALGPYASTGAGGFAGTSVKANEKYGMKSLSSSLIGTRIVAFFVRFDGSEPKRESELRFLTSHDADEVALFLDDGFGPGSSAPDPARVCTVPLYVEAAREPIAAVKDPIRLSKGELLVYDGRCPHFAYGPRGAVAMYVATAATTYFRYRSGLSFALEDFEALQRKRVVSGRSRRELDSPHAREWMVGRRARRIRDIQGLKAEEVARGQVPRKLLGKLESGSLERLRFGHLFHISESLDAELEEFIPTTPPFLCSLAPDRFTGSNTTESLLDAAAQQDFAVRPIVVTLEPGERSPQTGTADVVVLCVSGRVTIEVCLRPLFYALGQMRGSEERPDSDWESVELGVNDALQFKAACPHVVAARVASVLLVFTTRCDETLPSRWVG